MKNTNGTFLSDDTLKNILLMAPLLDEAGQNKVYGLMCGLIASTPKPKGDVCKEKTCG